MSLFFITGNTNKFEEAKAILPQLERLDMDLKEIQSLDSRDIIKEKLQEAILHHPGQECVVEDTSLSLVCLHGLPGPFIKWFLQTIGNDGLFSLAEKFDEYHAEAKTMIGYVEKTGDLHFFEGAIYGRIVKPQGETKFGWDPIFIPDGFSTTFAEITKEEKNKISMRRMAFQQLKEFLDRQ